MTAHMDRDENTTGTDAAKATLTIETFPHSNETTVTFFDEDGYEYSLVLTNPRDEADARTRAHCAARAKILDDEWRPHGTLLISGLDVRDMTRARTRPGGRYDAEGSWRAEAATHLQGAIAELERAALVMPASCERALIDRALRTTAQTFRECTRNLGAARRHLEAPHRGRAAGDGTATMTWLVTLSEKRNEEMTGCAAIEIYEPAARDRTARPGARRADNGVRHTGRRALATRHRWRAANRPATPLGPRRRPSAVRTVRGRAQAALPLGCPRCQARAGQPCIDLRMLGTGRRIVNLAPHPERLHALRDPSRVPGLSSTVQSER